MRQKLGSYRQSNIERRFQLRINKHAKPLYDTAQKKSQKDTSFHDGTT